MGPAPFNRATISHSNELGPPCYRNLRLDPCPQSLMSLQGSFVLPSPCFRDKGFHGTSTRDIARLADVSEVTVYRYFEHKEDIFWASVWDSRSSSTKPRLGLLDTSPGLDLPELILPRVLTLSI